MYLLFPYCGFRASRLLALLYLRPFLELTSCRSKKSFVLFFKTIVFNALIPNILLSRLSEEQKKGTEAALLDAVTYTVSNIDRGLVTSLVTADTSKAFDSVEHGRLLDKLGWYGIDYRWFAAWLRDRTQAVTGATEDLRSPSTASA